MANRTNTQQSKHDQKVEEEAKRYKAGGYQVWADLKDWPSPKIINNHQPDVIAQYYSIEKIIEVETPESIEQDKEQHRAFQRYADSKLKTEFKLVIAK
ncbi:MAG: hypothetical protein KJ771_08530 [Nanoarchaeota archaeon]|nr:hypothetical protein [Nanoarchaeota archaeon]